MEEYTFSQGKQMRCGYTTGSCAAAAAKAAAMMLLSGRRIDFADIDTRPRVCACTLKRTSLK